MRLLKETKVKPEKSCLLNRGRGRECSQVVGEVDRLSEGIGPLGRVAASVGCADAVTSVGKFLPLWVDHLRAGNRSEGTVKLRVYHVECFEQWCAKTGGHGLSSEGVAAYLGAHGWSAATRRSVRTSLGLWCAFLEAQGVLEVNPVAKLPSVIVERRLPRPCPDEAIVRAVVEAEPRVRCMVMLAAEAGLRRMEIAVVQRDDFMKDLFGWSLHVHGKGRKSRVVPLTESVMSAVSRQWLDVPAFCPWLFPSSRGGHLQPIRVGELVNEALPGAWTTHTLRHRFATRAYQGSKDLLMVQKLLGHEKPETTAMYVGMDTSESRAVVEMARLEL